MFIKGKKYMQEDGLIILAGEKGTNGVVIIDPKNLWGVGHYSEEWNPKAFKPLGTPKKMYNEEELLTLHEKYKKYCFSKKSPFSDNIILSFEEWFKQITKLGRVKKN
jgi:hypothetical protein